MTGGGKDSLLVHFDPNYKKLEETFLNENLGKIPIFFFFLKVEAVVSLFRNMRFMLEEMLQPNASKFAICLEYENPHSFDFFSFCVT